MNIMFKVANTDYSTRIPGEQYAVRSVKQYDGWTDANGREHRSVFRECIEGTFTMHFVDIAEFDAFCAYVESQSNYDSSVPCTVWVNNKNAAIQSDFFLDFNATRYIGPAMNDLVETVKVTIKER
jgi:hypothetical protein